MIFAVHNAKVNVMDVPRVTSVHVHVQCSYVHDIMYKCAYHQRRMWRTSVCRCAAGILSS